MTSGKPSSQTTTRSGAQPPGGSGPVPALRLAVDGQPAGAQPGTPAEAGTAPPLPPAERLINRDVSWLEFNRRVLAQATDSRTPVFDRIRFLGIFSSNLDEFFMKRIGYLKHQSESGKAKPTPEGYMPQQVIAAAREIVIKLQTEQAACLEEEILPALASHDIRLLRYADLAEHERVLIDEWFRVNVFPVLTPLAVDPGHRFPFISNLSESLGVMVAQPGEAERHFARVKIPDVLPRLVPVPAPQPRPGDSRSGSAPAVRFIPLDEVIRHNLDDLFPGMQIHEVLMFRVTRNAAIEVDDDEHTDMLASVENELRMRRFARAVRLEVAPGAPRASLDFVVNALRLTADDVYERRGPLEYQDLFPISDLPRPELKSPRWPPVTPARLSEDKADIFAAIRDRDILVHHPYESFNASVERFIADAARDPNVLAIKQTIYRTATDSPFVGHLVRAAEEGKQVAVLVELRARFDESRNVRFARQLEKAGVHVAYGVVGYKTHCKIALVVRREPAGLRSYAHVGTGNYNPSTAQLYTDLSLLTCDAAITEDLVGLFNHLTGRSLKRTYNHLIVAPFNMRDRWMEFIDREIGHARAGRPARIAAKMNSLEDLKITEKLYEASRAGVKVDLVVRGFCCLRPGVPGLSENIRVISIVGRFLEHSRIFHFSNGQADPVAGDWYIGSADWMYRNLSARVEAAAPVRDPLARQRLKRILEVMFRDHRSAWELRSDGGYTQRFPPENAEPDSPEVAGTFQTLMWDAQTSARAGA